MKKILIIRLGAIGDVILTSPAALNLKLSFPEARIYFLTRRRISGLLEFFAGVDEVLEFPQKASFIQLFRMAEYLDKLRFDMIVDLHGNIRSKYLMHHITASVKVQYGKRRLERLAAVKWKKINPRPPHTIDLYNDAVRKCGGKIFAGRPVFRLNSNKKLFNISNLTIAIAPGASFPVKQWPADRFKSLAMDIFGQLQANIVLLLTEKDREIIELKSEIPQDRIKIFIDTDLTEIAEILSKTDLLVSNDSAIAHLGSAVGTPVIAIFGPTHPTLGFAPAGMRDIVMQTDESCRPCSLHGRRSCYRDKQYCFDRITVKDVFEKVAEMIDSPLYSEKAIFIDRDGTLIKEKGFLDNPDDVEPEEGSIDAIKMAKKAGYKVIIISNQSGVARGYFCEGAVRYVNQRVLQIFGECDALIDDIFYCPHYRDGELQEYAIECRFRKPSPGMIEKACKKHNINPHSSYIVGDKLSDVNLAYVTGGKAVLVQTGYGRNEEKKLQISNSVQPERIEKNLYEAVKYIVGTDKHSQ